MLSSLKKLVRRVWRYRSSINGEWVSKEVAEANPATTQRERVK